jgi:hypothetical protein
MTDGEDEDGVKMRPDEDEDEDEDGLQLVMPLMVVKMMSPNYE